MIFLMGIPEFADAGRWTLLLLALSLAVQTTEKNRSVKSKSFWV